MTNLPFLGRLVTDIRNAAYISAFITFLFILIEVPVVIFYILTRYIVTFAFSMLGLALYYLVTMLWSKLTTSTSPEPKETSL
jgi:uncharacterized membrane protein